MKKQREIIISVLVIILSLVIVYMSVLFGNKTLMPITYIGRSTDYLTNNESVINYIEGGAAGYLDSGASDWVENPIVSAVNRNIHNSELPLWDSYSSMGMPIIDNTNGSTLAPLQIIVNLFNSDTSWNLMYIVRVFVIMLFTFLFLREMKLDYKIALVGGILFGLSGYVQGFLNIFFLHVDAWFPMLMWATLRYVHKKDILSWNMIVCSIVFMILGGNPQNLITCCVCAVLFYCVEVIDKKKGVKLSAIKICKYISTYMLAILLTMYYWLSFLTLYLNGFSYHKNAGIKKLNIKSIIGLILPVNKLGSEYKLQFWLPYIGMVIVIILITHLTLKKNCDYFKEKIFGISFIALFLLKIFGLFLVNWIGYLPILNALTFTKYNSSMYFLIIMMFCFSINDILKRNCKVSQNIRLAIASIISIVMLVCLILNFKLIYEYNTPAKIVVIVSVLIVLLMLLTFVVYKFWNNKIVFVIIICTLSIVELTGYSISNNSIRIDRGVATDYPEFATYLNENRDNEYDRVFSIGTILMGNLSANYGLQSFNGISATPEINYYNFASRLILGNNLDLQIVDTASSGFYLSSKRYLDLLGVKYIIVDNDTNMDEIFGVPIYNKKGVRIYNNDTSYARAFAVHNIIEIDDQDKVLDYLEDVSNDLTLTAVVSNVEYVNMDIEENDGYDSVAIEEYNANKVLISANMKSNGLLILSDLFYPGWEVYVDGNKQDIIQTDSILRGVYLQEGVHLVEFVYRPKALMIGLLISMFAFVVTIVGEIIIRKRCSFS